MQTGEVHADGDAGGSVRIAADRVLSSAAIAAGGRAQGPAGQVDIGFAENYVGTVDAVVSADGVAGGGRVRISGGDSGRLFTSGTVSATGSGASASGGVIELLGRELVLIGATADASGRTPAAGSWWAAAGRDAIRPSRTPGQSRRAGSRCVRTGQAGGTIVVWSDEATTFGGSLSTVGRVGGTIEVSSQGELVYAGTADAGTGRDVAAGPQEPDRRCGERRLAPVQPGQPHARQWRLVSGAPSCRSRPATSW